MTMRRILITGLSGLIGSALRKHVEGKYTLRALNRRAVPGVETHQADLGDLVAGRYAKAGKVTPLTHESPLRPSGLYGATKVWGEALGRHYSDAHRMSVICLRIGRVKAEDRPTTTRDVAVWCSQRDIVRMIEACIEAPESVRFDVFYVVSNLRHGYRDVEHARKVLGWTPMDSADTPR